MINESLIQKVKDWWLVNKASRFAAHKHRNHKRKYTGEPYWNHLHEVAQLVKHVAKGDARQQAAAYLHDTIEDTDTTKEELQKHFGHDVAQLAWECTDQHPYHCHKKKDNWYHNVTGKLMNRAARKEINNEHLKRSSPRGATIKLADFVSNTKDIMKHDPHKFGPKYVKEKQEVLPYLKHGHPKLYKMAEKNVF